MIVDHEDRRLNASLLPLMESLEHTEQDSR